MSQFYEYSPRGINQINAEVDGVYYLANNNRVFLYIGKSFRGQGGIKDRLLEHFRAGKWLDVTQFCYTQCQTNKESLELEEAEIEKYDPKYNY